MSNTKTSEKIIILSFDIALEKASLRVKVWRKLKEIGAKLRMKSHWVLPFSERNLTYMEEIAREIIKASGKAEILVGEKVI
jgi:hypothetical protein